MNSVCLPSLVVSWTFYPISHETIPPPILPLVYPPPQEMETGMGMEQDTEVIRSKCPISYPKKIHRKAQIPALQNHRLDLSLDLSVELLEVPRTLMGKVGVGVGVLLSRPRLLVVMVPTTRGKEKRRRLSTRSTSLGCLECEQCSLSSSIGPGLRWLLASLERNF